MQANKELYARDFKKKLILSLPENSQFIRPEKPATRIV